VTRALLSDVDEVLELWDLDKMLIKACEGCGSSNHKSTISVVMLWWLEF
jgi:hypothetical protein